jgi:hypothetical protein
MNPMPTDSSGSRHGFVVAELAARMNSAPLPAPHKAVRPNYTDTNHSIPYDPLKSDLVVG